jgi:RAD54-like protein 2
VLQQTLPMKYEFVILLRLTPFQRELYNTFMNDVVRTKAVPNPLKAFAVCCKVSEQVERRSHSFAYGNENGMI